MRLHDVFGLGTRREVIDAVLEDALSTLGKVIPFDLATIMELTPANELAVRVVSGPLGGSETVRRHRLRLAEHPSLRDVIRTGQPRAFPHHDADDADPFDAVLDLPHGHFCMVSPLIVDRETMGLITLDRSVCGVYPEEMVSLAGIFGKLLGLVLKYSEQSALLTQLRTQLEEQNRLLRSRSSHSNAAGLLQSSASHAMRHVIQLARQVAGTDTPVLIQGETGTGKEVLANAICSWSERSARPMVSLNCAALPHGLIESELFGHVKGAFSGAVKDRIGRFQAAHRGTLFLDEVGELPLELQAKLLRVLQHGTFQPVGGDREAKVDVRILAATNRDLRQEVAAGRFREDLYYRLAIFPLVLPPLRARTEDIGVIARGFLAEMSRRTGRGPWVLSDEDLAILETKGWPGNVRELVNTLERATILSPGPLLRLDEARAEPLRVTPVRGEAFLTLKELEKQHILDALTRTGGKLYGDGGAAALLGLHPNTLASRMKKHGLGGARSHRS